MTPVTPVAATPSTASQRQPAPREIRPPAAALASSEADVGSTQVTLGSVRSTDYGDRLAHRSRIGVEVVLAGGGGALHGAGIGGASRQMTYSFTPQVGSAAALDADADGASSEQQQAAVRAMVYLAAMMNVRFVEVAMGGQVSFGGAVAPPDAARGDGQPETAGPVAGAQRDPAAPAATPRPAPVAHAAQPGAGGPA